MKKYDYTFLSTIKISHPDQHSLNKPVKQVFIELEENELKTSLPNSFKQFLMQYNGAKLYNNYQIFGVYNPKDPKKSWDSILRQNKQEVKCLGLRSSLIIFCKDDYGNAICFDTEDVSIEGEYGVVFVDHESGIETKVADSFYDWVIGLEEER